VSYYEWKNYPFLQIDLENVTKVTRIATQGSFDINWWTKTYTLDYSLDGVTFISHNNGQVLAQFSHLHINIWSGWGLLFIRIYHTTELCVLIG